MHTRPSSASKYAMRPSSASRSAGWSSTRCEPLVPITRGTTPPSSAVLRSSQAPLALTTASAVTLTTSPVVSSRSVRVLPAQPITRQWLVATERGSSRQASRISSSTSHSGWLIQASKKVAVQRTAERNNRRSAGCTRPILWLGITRWRRPNRSYRRSPAATASRPRVRWGGVRPKNLSALLIRPPKKLESGTTVFKGCTRCGALRNSRLRSRVDSATSAKLPLSR